MEDRIVLESSLEGTYHLTYKFNTRASKAGKESPTMPLSTAVYLGMAPSQPVEETNDQHFAHEMSNESHQSSESLQSSDIPRVSSPRPADTVNITKATTPCGAYIVSNKPAERTRSWRSRFATFLRTLRRKMRLRQHE